MRTLRLAICLLTLAAPPARPAAAQRAPTLPAGTIVLAREGEMWVRARIVEVGTGERAGYYKVRADEVSPPVWVTASNVRARALEGAPGTGHHCREGEHVEAWDSGWIPATVVSVGEDELENYCRVKYDASGSVQWISANNIRASSTPAPTTAASRASECPAKFHVGDRVEGYNDGWWRVRVLGVGTGHAAGFYRVKYEDYPDYSPGWLKCSALRRKESGGARDHTDGPSEPDHPPR